MMYQNNIKFPCQPPDISLFDIQIETTKPDQLDNTPYKIIHHRLARRSSQFQQSQSFNLVNRPGPQGHDQYVSKIFIPWREDIPLNLPFSPASTPQMLRTINHK